jgi:hypothetical protein
MHRRLQRPPLVRLSRVRTLEHRTAGDASVTNSAYAPKNIAERKNDPGTEFFLLILEIDVLSILRAGRALDIGLPT